MPGTKLGFLKSTDQDGTAPQLHRAMRASLRSFSGDTGGAVAMIFAFLIVILVGAGGSAVDFFRSLQARSAYQNALDAGSLAGARVKQMGGTDMEALQAAEAYLKPVKARHRLDGTADFKIVNGGTAMEGTTNLAMPTNFLNLLGISKLPIKLANTAVFSQATNVELAMMLDVTGSMKGTKIADLKTAVEELVDIVVTDNQSGASSRIALAPFSHAVKLDTKSFREATGRNNSGSGSYKGCVVERTGPSAFTDAGPGAGAYLTPLEDKNPGAPCDDGREVFPLSDKKSDLKKMVRALTAGGSTAGHLGTAWAWYMLSPNWSDLFDNDNKPAPYADLEVKDAKGVPKLRKIAVLMTDGEYNTQYTATASTTQARNICAELKKTKIEVFTVGFELGGSPAAIDTLKACASSTSHFYNATNGEELRRAFRDIALKSSPLRISK